MKKWLACLGLMIVMAQSAQAWRPTGRVTFALPWAYDASSNCYWFDPSDEQWVYNNSSGRWSLLFASDLANSTINDFPSWPWVYWTNNATWYYIKEGDTQWCVKNPGIDDEWSVFGVTNMVSDDDGDGMPNWWESKHGLNPLSGMHSSLVGWWKMDDVTGTNAINSVSTNYVGELRGFAGAGNTGWGANGMLGGALTFDGTNDVVRVAKNPSVLTGEAFTVSAWAWLDASCTSDWPEVVSDYDAGGYFAGFVLGYSTNNRAYAMMGVPIIEDSYMMSNDWAWVAFEYNGTAFSLYCDGIQVGNSVQTNFFCTTNSFFEIGNGQDSSYRELWKGKIDDVRLYRSALGTNGIATMYDAFEDLDGDGLDNRSEYQRGTFPDKTDTDGDGINDGDEVTIHHTNPAVSDTDGDGINDGNEVTIYHTNPVVADTDGDGMSDGDEVAQGYNPVVANEAASVWIESPENGRAIP